MRIKLTNIARLGIVLALVAFFSFVGYKDLFYDQASAAEHKVNTSVRDMNSRYQHNEKQPQEYYGNLRAQIALAEYRKNISEDVKGCNCGAEIDKYTEGNRAQWCTMFASWVTKEAGSPLTNARTKSWRLNNSRDLAVNLEKNGTWYSREEIIAQGIKPKTGDFMVFWRGNFEDNLGHVDIVIDVDSGPGKAGLLGGNLKDKVQYREFPYLEYYGFLGFGRPEKEDSSH